MSATPHHENGHTLSARSLRLEPASTPANLRSLKRLNALLLPVNYGDRFYKDILSNPTDDQLTRVCFRDVGDSIGPVGGIRCRLERPEPCSSDDGGGGGGDGGGGGVGDSDGDDGGDNSGDERGQGGRGGKIYIMTLCTLSPFRGLGVATALLQHILVTARDWGVSEVYAHVWEENREALEWYRRRGFDDSEFIEQYYRKLQPAGARVVRYKVSSSSSSSSSLSSLRCLP